MGQTDEKPLKRLLREDAVVVTWLKPGVNEMSSTS